MATPEVMEKRKSTRTCKNCGSNLGGDEKKCHNCGSMSIKKITLIVKKVAEDEVPSAEDEVPDYSMMEETARESAPPEQDSAERAGVVKEHYGDDEEDEENYEDDEEEEAVRMTKLNVAKNISETDLHAIGAEAAVIVLDAAEKVVKALTSDTPKDDFEEAMNDVNNAADVAFLEWAEGGTVEKTGDKLAMLKQKRKLLQRKLALLTGGGMDEDDDVEKSDDIYKGLSPEIEKRLRRADELVEKSAVAEWEGIAKSFANVPADYSALAVALRSVSEKDASAYAVIKSVLDAANTNLESSDVFKSFGQTGAQTGNDDNMDSLAKSWVEQGKYATLEQARVAVMDANPEKFYQPTNR